MISWLLVPALAAPPDADVWEETLDRVSRAVVSIQVTATRDFDTEDASNSQGTGFVIDAEQGLILTNRHMVHAGPVTARAVFHDNEEAHLAPIYRDPVHDFGLYRFDPADIQYMAVTELQLDADAAKVGMEIRVVGNDAGEKLSILDGTLARLDRNAPYYGRDTYNDFNTFYIQAASNTSGGSSGSPVVDVQGRVVALNAGGRNEAASSFYLPLHRVVRAVEHIRRGEPVSRGTLGTTFEHATFQDVERRLAEPTEARIRRERPQATGVLVVDRVLPGGPTDGALRAGDVLVTVDGALVTDFVSLEAVLDERVGGQVVLGMERLGVAKEIALDVADLHAISPDRYFEISRAILHDLSYQVARIHEVPLRGVYVASAGYMLGGANVGDGDLITHVDGVELPDLDAAVEVLSSKADGQRIRVRHAPVSDLRQVREDVAVVDRTWFPTQTCVRDDRTGHWPCVSAPDPPVATSEERPSIPLPIPASVDRKARGIASALVLVAFDVPYSTAGVSGTSFVGAGVVVDREQGLVLVDRDTVPVALGDLELTFAGAIRVPAEVVLLHPVHNFAIVRYDPAALGDLPVGEVAFGDTWIAPDDKVRVIGLDRAGAIVVDETEVRDVDALYITPSGTPRFRDFNVEVAGLQRVDRSVGGVVVDKRHRVLGLWASFFFPNGKDRAFYVLPAPYLRDTIATVKRGEQPVFRTPGLELAERSLADARDLGLSDARIRAYVAHDPDHLRLLSVVRVTGGSGASGLVREADLVVLADGKPVSQMRDVERWARKPFVKLTLLRDGEEVTVDLPMTELDGLGVREVISWAGMLLHAPHPEVAQTRGIVPEGPYVAWFWYGSPAARDGVRATRRIVEVDGVPTPDLDSFVEAVRDLTRDEPIVLRLEKLDEAQFVRSLRVDLDAWPTERIRWVDGAWVRTRVEPAPR